MDYRLEKEFMKGVNDIEEHIRKFSEGYGEQLEKLQLSERELRDEIMQLKQKGSAGYVAPNGSSGKRSLGSMVWDEMQKNAELLAKTSKIRMEIKAAGDALTTTHAGNRLQGGVGMLVESEIGIQGAFQVRPASGVSSLVYSRYTGIEGAASAQAGEGAAKSAVRPTFSEITQQAITIAGYTKISRQALSDSSELQRAIDVTLSRSISSSLDSLLNSGNVTPAFSGLLALATSYTSLVYTSLADAASEAVATMQEAGFLPSIVAFSPSDWLAVQTALNPVSGDYLAGPYLLRHYRITCGACVLSYRLP